MTRVPFVSQMEASECGAACLAMVLAHHGHHASLVDVREACGVSRDGTSAAALMRAAQSFGLTSKGRRLEPEQLKREHLPAILHWEFNHFVVATRVSKRGFEILDPAVGPRRVSAGQMNDAFTGVALTFARGPAFQRAAPPGAGRSRYLRVFAKALPGMGLTLVAAAVLELLGLLFPVASQIAIDFIVLPRQPRFLLALGIVLALSTILRFAIATARNRVLGGLRMNLDAWLATAFVEHLTRLPLSFFSQRGAGDLVNRAESHAVLRETIRSLSTTFLDALLVVSYSALMLLYDARLGGIVIAITVLRASLAILAQGLIQRDAVTEVVASAKESTIVTEAFAASEAVKAFGLQASMQQRYTDAVADRLNASVRRERIEHNVLHLLPLLSGVTLGLVYYVGGQQVAHNQMTVGVLSAFVAMSALLNEPLRALVAASTGIPQLRQLLRRLDDIWQARTERQGGIAPPRLSGTITLSAVTVRHGGGAPVLQDVDLRVGAGERVVIVGSSGSGKSTLAQVIAGLLPATSGHVWLDQHSLHELDLSEVYAQVGLVAPDAPAFRASVHQNIALGAGERSFAQVVSAARDAAIDGDIVRMKDGYETQLERSGAPLSGGQRQRVAIARALLKNPRVLILDEATSSLDLAVEQEILERLATRDCTQIVVTHRVSVMRGAPRIIVMQRGQIVNEGSFDDLSSRCPVFNQMLQAHAEVKL